jgi:hypothetical protein
VARIFASNAIGSPLFQSHRDRLKPLPGTECRSLDIPNNGRNGLFEPVARRLSDRESRDAILIGRVSLKKEEYPALTEVFE